MKLDVIMEYDEFFNTMKSDYSDLWNYAKYDTVDLYPKSRSYTRLLNVIEYEGSNNWYRRPKPLFEDVLKYIKDNEDLHAFWML